MHACNVHMFVCTYVCMHVCMYQCDALLCFSSRPPSMIKRYSDSRRLAGWVHRQNDWRGGKKAWRDKVAVSVEKENPSVTGRSWNLYWKPENEHTGNKLQNEKSKPVFYSTRDINSTVSMKKSGSDPLLSYHNVNLCLLVLPWLPCS